MAPEGDEGGETPAQRTLAIPSSKPLVTQAQREAGPCPRSCGWPRQAQDFDFVGALRNRLWVLGPSLSLVLRNWALCCTWQRSQVWREEGR